MNYSKFIYIFISLIFATTFFSCGADYLTKTIEFDDIGFEPAMVLNAKVSSSQDSMLISISKNVNYAQNSNANYEFINGVTLDLAVDGVQKYQAEEIELLVNDTVLYNYLIILDEEQISGKEYTISALHPDYPSIESTTFLSAASEPQNLQYQANARTAVVFLEPQNQDLIEFDIVDNPDEENYYLFKVLTPSYIDTFIFDYGYEIDTVIVDVEPFSLDLDIDDPNAVIVDFSTMLISDQAFNGQTISVDLYASNYDWLTIEGRIVEYRNITKSEYLFRQSFSNYQNAQDIGIFAEPVTLYSNVENGFGLFSGEDRFQYEVE